MPRLAKPPLACGLDGMGREKLGGKQVPCERDKEVCRADGYRQFYEYYQIGGNGEPDEAEEEPKDERELTSDYEGSHSPFGFVWQIASETGWSVDYILNGVNYQTLIMMLSDAPHYVSKKNGRRNDERSAEEEASDIVGFFQSRLK